MRKYARDRPGLLRSGRHVKLDPELYLATKNRVYACGDYAGAILSAYGQAPPPSPMLGTPRDLLRRLKYPLCTSTVHGRSSSTSSLHSCEPHCRSCLLSGHMPQKSFHGLHVDEMVIICAQSAYVLRAPVVLMQFMVRTHRSHRRDIA